MKFWLQERAEIDLFLRKTLVRKGFNGNNVNTKIEETVFKLKINRIYSNLEKILKKPKKDYESFKKTIIEVV